MNNPDEVRNVNPDETPETGGQAQTEVEDNLEQRGYDGQFGAREGARVLCFTCRAEFSATELDAAGASRLEGESDPDDMALVVPIVCPVCGEMGSLSLQYGPGAGTAESEVVAALNRTATLPMAAESDAVEASSVAPTEHADEGSAQRSADAADASVAQQPEDFEAAESGTLRDQHDSMIDPDGDDIRRYTGEPVETEQGWVVPVRQSDGDATADPDERGR